MKKNKIIIILLVIFVISLISIVLVFSNNITNIKLVNKAKDLANYINKIDYGSYYYKQGVLYDDKSNILTSEFYFNGEGNIYKDKYNNIKISLNLSDRCIQKTSLGNIEIKRKCSKESDLSPIINRNNSQITFKFNNEIYEYKYSNKDDFKGDWIKLNSNILVLNLYEEGTHYIWFKDKDGNVSGTISFDVSCFLNEGSEYDKNILYCTGSILNIDGSEWIVVEDKDNYTTLMRLESLDIKLSHTKDETYKWSTSLINKYLNEEYIYKLNNDLRNKLIEVNICDDSSGTLGCDSGDGCGGYKKEAVEKYNWSCDKYTKSKIRIISYDEYSYLYDNLNDKEKIYGNYWMINTYKDSLKAMSVTYNGQVYVNENTTSLLEVKPLITINKN